MKTWVRAPLTRATTAVAAAFLCVATSCGGGGTPKAAPSAAVDASADQTVEIRMVDIAFRPGNLTVKAGTAVRFVFKNDGDLEHQAAFGDEATQRAVEAGTQPRDGPAVGARQTKALVRRFESPGTLLIGCHVAGHYAAGMKMVLTVA